MECVTSSGTGDMTLMPSQWHDTNAKRDADTTSAPQKNEEKKQKEEKEQPKKKQKSKI